MEHVVLTPDANEWDPHNKSYELLNEASFMDYRGDLNYPSPKRTNVIDDRDYIDFDMSSEMFEAVIDAIVASTDILLMIQTLKIWATCSTWIKMIPSEHTSLISACFTYAVCQKLG